MVDGTELSGEILQSSEDAKMRNAKVKKYSSCAESDSHNWLLVFFVEGT